MSLSERVEKDYIEAYKAKLMDKVGVLRLLKTAVKNRLVEMKRPGGLLSDEEMLDVIIKQAKQREDSIEQYAAAGRKDLADREVAELEILKKYLPEKLDAEQLVQEIDKFIAQAGATGMKDMGKVMGLLLGAFKGQVDGKEASDAVKKRLSALQQDK